MFKTYRKLILKLAALCLLAGGVFVVQNTASAKTDCPICPWPNWHCNHVTGDCECDCPNPDGSCPASCA